VGRKIEVKSNSLQDTLPEMDEFDWLIIMGGPMNIYHKNEFPWLDYKTVLADQL